MNKRKLIQNLIIATFTDETAILASVETIEVASNKLQTATYNIHERETKWRINLNEYKTVDDNFSNEIKDDYLPVGITNQLISHAKKANYLGLNFGMKWLWNEPIKKK